jgi:hypothetical protein
MSSYQASLPTSGEQAALGIASSGRTGSFFTRNSS